MNIDNKIVINVIKNILIDYEKNPYRRTRTLGSLEGILLISNVLPLGAEFDFLDIEEKYKTFWGKTKTYIRKEFYQEWIIRKSKELVDKLEKDL